MFGAMSHVHCSTFWLYLFVAVISKRFKNKLSRKCNSLHTGRCRDGLREQKCKLNCLCLVGEFLKWKMLTVANMRDTNAVIEFLNHHASQMQSTAFSFPLHPTLKYISVISHSSVETWRQHAFLVLHLRCDAIACIGFCGASFETDRHD